jgi:hypothetical protein
MSDRLDQNDGFDLERLSGDKILRIPSYFAKKEESMRGFALALGLEVSQSLDFKIVDAFKELGYKIKRGGTFNTANPAEVGIESNYEKEGNKLTVAKEISSKIGIDMPQHIPFKDIVDSSFPLVGQDAESHGGESIYFLESREQKINFLTWVVSAQYSNTLAKVQRNKAQVESGKIPYFFDTDEKVNSWYFEKYIATPSDYYTSFRIVADCLGQVHFGLLTRSLHKKGTEKIKDLQLHRPTKTPEEFIEKATQGGEEVAQLIQNPNSPLYVGSQSIVSNYGASIDLGMQSHADETDRVVLEAHGIDPDVAAIPEILYQASSIIGKECRGDYPFVGVDYLMDRKGKYYLKEVNTGPNISPERVGLPKDTPRDEVQIELIKQIFSQ